MDGGEQDQLYRALAAEFGAALERLTRGYEANLDRRRDLLQDVHVAVWRSLAAFDGRCSRRTWVYRVAHNVGASHLLKRRRAAAGGFASLEDLELADAAASPEQITGERRALARLTEMIRSLGPPDSQVMLLYLEDLDAAAIGEITGLTPGAVATKIHRIKSILAKRFQEGGAS